MKAHEALAGAADGNADAHRRSKGPRARQPNEQARTTDVERPRCGQLFAILKANLDRQRNVGARPPAMIYCSAREANRAFRGATFT